MTSNRLETYVEQDRAENPVTSPGGLQHDVSSRLFRPKDPSAEPVGIHRYLDRSEPRWPVSIRPSARIVYTASMLGICIWCSPASDGKSESFCVRIDGVEPRQDPMASDTDRFTW